MAKQNARQKIDLYFRKQVLDNFSEQSDFIIHWFFELFKKAGLRLEKLEKYHVKVVEDGYEHTGYFLLRPEEGRRIYRFVFSYKPSENYILKILKPGKKRDVVINEAEYKEISHKKVLEFLKQIGQLL